MKLWYWTLSSGSRSSLRSIACCLRSAERREFPSCLGTNFVGSLSTNLPSFCWVVCVMKCCSQSCCCIVMVDCSTGSTSQKRFKLCFRLLAYRSRNVCWVSCRIVVAGFRPESIKPRNVICRTEWIPGRVLRPHRSISAPMSRSMSPGWSNFSSCKLLSLGNFQVLVSKLVDGLYQ